MQARNGLENKIKQKRKSSRLSIKLEVKAETDTKKSEQMTFDRHDEDLLELMYTNNTSKLNEDSDDDFVNPINEERKEKLRSQKLHLEFIDNKRSLQCNVCSKNFATLNCLKSHILEEFNLSRIKPTKNPIESVVFTETSDPFIKDIYATLFTCDICNRRFMFYNQLASHKREHDNKKLFTCRLCHMNFISEDVYNEHIEIHSTKIRCEECQMTFVSNEAKRRHIRAEHLHLPPVRYECKLCGMVVTNIFAHVSLHHQNVVVCNLCQRHFTTNTDYERHMHSCKVSNKTQSLEVVSMDVACGSDSGDLCVHRDPQLVLINTLLNSKACETQDLKFESDSNCELSPKRRKIQ